MAQRTEIQILSDGAGAAGVACGSTHTEAVTETAETCAPPFISDILIEDTDGESRWALDDDDISDAIDLMETSWYSLRSVLLYVKMQPARRRLLQNHADDLRGFLEQFVELRVEKDEPPLGWRRP